MRPWLLLLGCLLACARVEPERGPARVILIVVDTLRRDHVSAYGGSVPTPHIDRLAARGQVFTHALASFHQTTMSMAALFTGRTPSLESGQREQPLPWTRRTWCGLARFANAELDSCVPASLPTLGEDFRSAGYWTAGVVSNPLLFRPYGYHQGFDEWVEVPERLPGLPPLRGDDAVLARAAPKVNRSVRRVLDERPGDRLFLYVHYVDVHDWVLLERSYADAVIQFDRDFAELLDALEARGLLEDAVVVFTSDHGEMLVDHHLEFETRTHFGNPSFEPVLRIPLIVVPPTELASAQPIRTQDLRGFVLRLAGLESPAEDPPGELRPDEILLTEQRFQTYREGSWKSIWSRSGDEVRLFHLDQDPVELEDLASQRPEILDRHRSRIEALTGALATQRGLGSELSPEDVERLRSLGYLE